MAATFLVAFALYRLDGLRESLRCGPAHFVRLYAKTASKLEGLPPVPKDLRAAWSEMDLCSSERQAPAPR